MNTEEGVFKEKADFRLLTSIVHGLKRETGKELRYQKP
jgi:hypothetical protein